MNTEFTVMKQSVQIRELENKVRYLSLRLKSETSRADEATDLSFTLKSLLDDLEKELVEYTRKELESLDEWTP